MSFERDNLHLVVQKRNSGGTLQQFAAIINQKRSTGGFSPHDYKSGVCVNVFESLC